MTKKKQYINIWWTESDFMIQLKEWWNNKWDMVNIINTLRYKSI